MEPAIKVTLFWFFLINLLPYLVLFWEKWKSVRTHAPAVQEYILQSCLLQLLKQEITKEANSDSSHSYLITFIHKYKEEIKSGHDGSWQIYILFQRFWSVIVSTDWVCCCQNGCPGIQSSLTTKEIIVTGLKRHLEWPINTRQNAQSYS